MNKPVLSFTTSTLTRAMNGAYGTAVMMLEAWEYTSGNVIVHTQSEATRRMTTREFRQVKKVVNDHELANIKDVL